VQRLPCDFKTRFPEPLPEAIDAGTLDESDATPDALRSMHEAYSKTILATLQERDRLFAARRTGIDPVSGRKPPTAAGRERLRKYLADAPERQQHAFDVLLMTYADAFGFDAADAFSKALNAWHAGIEVVPDGSTRLKADALPAPADATAEQPHAVRARRPRRLSSSLPVPKPLRSAVQSGVFGRDEHGPVRPSPEEVRAITEEHAEKLAELLAGATAASSKRGLEQFEEGISAYAEDFGTRAGERLRSHVEALVKRQQRDFISRPR
jgi:hypothetical protein